MLLINAVKQRRGKTVKSVFCRVPRRFFQTPCITHTTAPLLCPLRRESFFEEFAHGIRLICNEVHLHQICKLPCIFQSLLPLLIGVNIGIEKIAGRLNAIGTQFFEWIAGAWSAAHVHEQFHLRAILLVCYHFEETSSPYARIRHA